MKLSLDCVRDILLYVKIYSDSGNIGIDSLVNRLYKYERNLILDHIRELDDKGIFKEVVYLNNEPYSISGLSLKGCDYLSGLLLII